MGVGKENIDLVTIPKDMSARDVIVEQLGILQRSSVVFSIDRAFYVH